MNTFPVFVDLLTLNLNDANHHFAKTANLAHDGRYRLCVLAALCNTVIKGPTIVTIIVKVNCLLHNGFIRIELTFNAINVGANQRGAHGHGMKACVCRWVHFFWFKTNESINVSIKECFEKLESRSWKLEYGLPLGLFVMSHF